MLTEIEELGLKIAVLIRKQKIVGYNCSECTDDMMASRNCNGDADHSVPVFYHPLLDAQLFVCPMRLIPRSIFSFLDMYDYYEKYPSAVPSYENVNPRYWDAVKLYEKFSYEVDSVPDKKADTDDNLSKMKSIMKTRKKNE